MRLAHALRFRILTRLYDPVVRSVPGVSRLQRRLLDLARPRPGQRALDLGCGTGNLLLLLSSQYPGVWASGLDADSGILKIARDKLSAGSRIELVAGSADTLPYADEAFDIVLSSLVFHHLDSAQKRGAFRESLRVLRPGGMLLLADWGRPEGPVLTAAFTMVRALDGFKRTQENVQGRLPALMRDAGFVDVEVVERSNLIVGTIELLIGRREAG